MDGGAKGHSPMHMAGRSKELLQSDCICPLTQAHWHAAIALAATARQARKSEIFFIG
jgi:hypothetical protein